MEIRNLGNAGLSEAAQTAIETATDAQQRWIAYRVLLALGDYTAAAAVLADGATCVEVGAGDNADSHAPLYIYEDRSAVLLTSGVDEVYEDYEQCLEGASDADRADLVARLDAAGVA
jgi:hypothetical protein